MISRLERERTIGGLDISYNSLGMVAASKLFVDGGTPDWSRVRFETAVKRPDTNDGRELLAHDVRVFCVKWNIERVWAEDVPRSGFKIVSLAKLHAIVEWELARCGVRFSVANQSTARKLMFGCGRLPEGVSKKEQKAWITEPLKLAGATFKNADEADALVALNFGLSEIGCACMAGLLGPPEHFEAIRKERARERARERAKAKRRSAA